MEWLAYSLGTLILLLLIRHALRVDYLCRQLHDISESLARIATRTSDEPPRL